MLAIKGGTLLTPSERIENGVILIRGKKIIKIGKSVPIPANTELIDASGKFVIPGMIDAHCHTGICADGVGREHFDGNEMTDPVTPHLRAIDAIHPEDMAFKDLREAGVTTINTGPGSGNLIGGQAAVIKTYGSTIDTMLIKAPSAMKMALGENPKRVYGEQKKTPSTRMGNVGLLREWLTKAKNYLEKKAHYEQKSSNLEVGEKQGRKPDFFEIDLQLEELIRVLKKEIPAHIHAHRADDILTALRIADEFDIDVVLIHATEGYKVADLLAQRRIPCIVGPILFSRNKYELRGMNPKNPAILSRAGVKLAIQTDQMSAVRYITLDAALAAREGLDEMEALKAITLSPAEILGIDDRVGSLDVGKDADIVILAAHPFDITRGHVEQVLIGGELIYQKREDGTSANT